MKKKEIKEMKKKINADNEVLISRMAANESQYAKTFKETELWMDTYNKRIIEIGKELAHINNSEPKDEPISNTLNIEWD